MTKRTTNEYLTLRIDTGLKQRFEAFCTSCGMTVSGAINLLAKRAIAEKKIPFNVAAIGAEEFVARIQENRQVVRISVRIDKGNRESFAEICDHIGIPMSRIIKMFMVNCLNNGKMPF